MLIFSFNPICLPIFVLINRQVLCWWTDYKKKGNLLKQSKAFFVLRHKIMEHKKSKRLQAISNKIEKKAKHKYEAKRRGHTWNIKKYKMRVEKKMFWNHWIGNDPKSGFRNFSVLLILRSHERVGAIKSNVRV